MKNVRPTWISTAIRFLKDNIFRVRKERGNESRHDSDSPLRDYHIIIVLLLYGLNVLDVELQQWGLQFFEKFRVCI